MIRIALALAATTLAACGGDDAEPPDGEPDRVIEETRTLLLGERIEATMTGGPGDRAVIAVDAPSAALTWDLHAHSGGDTAIIAMGVSQPQIRYELVPADDDEYFLLLHNTGDAPVDITIDIELHGMRWTAFR
jgi:hypothetical protein